MNMMNANSYNSGMKTPLPYDPNQAAPHYSQIPHTISTPAHHPNQYGQHMAATPQPPIQMPMPPMPPPLPQ